MSTRLRERLDEPPTWVDDAACVGHRHPELWFAYGDAAEAARHICERCPVRAQCLAYALENDEEHGIWGGKSERELRTIRRQLRREANRRAARG